MQIPKTILDQIINDYCKELEDMKKELDRIDKRNRDHIKLYCEMNKLNIPEYLNKYGVKWNETRKLMGIGR